MRHSIYAYIWVQRVFKLICVQLFREDFMYFVFLSPNYIRGLVLASDADSYSGVSFHRSGGPLIVLIILFFFLPARLQLK